MEDQELAAIRAARQQQGGAQGGEDESGKQAAEEQMRRDLLATILDSAARERCECADLCIWRWVCVTESYACAFSGAYCACELG